MSGLGIVARAALLTGALAWGGCRNTAPPPEHAGTSAPSADESVASLRDRAGQAYGAHDYATCSELVLKAGAIAPPKGMTAYNDACCLALAGRADPSFSLLSRAISSGFREASWLAEDPDLASLHGDSRWAPLLDEAKRAEEAWLATINAELYQLYQADQGDRTNRGPDTDWDQVAARDEARRTRVKAILDAGGAKAAEDFFHAAMVFQHGSGPEDYTLANTLALRAVELQPENRTMRWLAAASEDRLLMSQGKAQRYGTQFVKTGELWELYEVDPAVTDEERERWGVPPLAQARERVVQMNTEGP